MFIKPRNSFFVLLAGLTIGIIPLGAASMAATMPSQPGTTSTRAIAQDLQSPKQLFEVSHDGSREYKTIEAAIAAATDPDIIKVIKVYPGTYAYPLTKNTRLRLMVPNTHLLGFGPEQTRIIARSDKGGNSWGVVEIRASNCSVEGLWIENRQHSLPTKSHGNKATALAVGSDLPDEPDFRTNLTGITIRNCKMTGKSLDRASKNFAWDVVTIGLNVSECLIDSCYMHGYADTLSTWAKELTVQNSTIVGAGWNAVYITCGLQDPPQYIANKEGNTRLINCSMGATHHYISGGANHTTQPNVPVIWVQNCSNYNIDGVLPEIARSSEAPKGMIVHVIGTPYSDPFSIKGGTGHQPEIIPGVIRGNGSQITSVTASSLTGAEPEIAATALTGNNEESSTSIKKTFSVVVTPNWNISTEINAGDILLSPHNITGAEVGDQLIVTPMFHLPEEFEGITISPTSGDGVTLRMVAGKNATNTEAPPGNVRITVMKY